MREREAERERTVYFRWPLAPGETESERERGVGGGGGGWTRKQGSLLLLTIPSQP